MADEAPAYMDTSLCYCSVSGHAIYIIYSLVIFQYLQALYLILSPLSITHTRTPHTHAHTPHTHAHTIYAHTHTCTHTHAHTHNTHIHTPAPPPIPSVNIEKSEITARSVMINLNNCAGLDPSFGTVKYVVRYSSPGGQELMAETTASTLKIKGLSAATVYTFAVTCNNTAGQSGTSVSVSATTKAEGLFNWKYISSNRYI